MAVENKPQNTPDPQGSGDAGGDEKLIFGKYKTIEEAEKAHKDLERKFHEGREEQSRVNERLELLEQRDEGYGRGSRFTPQDSAPTTDNTRLLTEFYQDPAKVLAENRRLAREEAKAELQREQQANTSHAQRVQAWTQQNEDVVAYGDLLTHYVGQTDGRLSIETRLDKAAAKVRARVIELRGKPAAGDPKPEDVIEGVDQGGQPAGGRKPAPAGGNPDPESQLASYATQRNRSIRKPLGVPREKA